MIQRRIAIWIAIGAAVAVAMICHLLAGEAGRPIRAHGAELPLLSQMFYPDALLIYFHPFPLGVWALIETIWGRNDHDRSMLLITTTLSVSMVFLAGFVLGIALPYIPGAPIVTP